MAKLFTEQLTKRFGGLVAVNQVTLEMVSGKILGIIGPNGSGKTTLVNVITGLYHADGGRIVFDGRDITHVPPHERARMGIARTFQLAQPFVDLTARENIMVGALFSRKLSLRAARRVADEVADWLGLQASHRDVSRLSALEIKKVEIGRALAALPRVLFLDEIMAGLNPEEASELIGLVHNLRANGLAIALIEHIMHVVAQLTDWVVVLNAGEVIAQGTYEQVSRDPKVIAAYLGEEEAQC